MKVLESSIDRGSVYAQVNISAADIAAAGSTQGAVKAAIDAFTAENGLPALIYVRVTAMDECGDGGIDVRFEGAIARTSSSGSTRASRSMSAIVRILRRPRFRPRRGTSAPQCPSL